jgi:hypothetical protein
MADHPLNDPLLDALREARPPSPPPPSATAAEALISRITAGGGAPAPGDSPARHSAGGYRRRGRWPRQVSRRPLLVTAGGVAAAVLAIAGLAAANVLGGGPQGQGTGKRTSTRFETAAYVVARIDTSAPAWMTNIIHVQSTDGKYIQDEWFGPRNNLVRLQTFSRSGRLLFDIAETGKAITVVDYADHDWWSLPNTPTTVPTILTCGTDCFIIKPGPRGRNGFPLSAGLTKSPIKNSRFQVSKTQSFRGQAATDLVARGPDGEVSQLWVNAASYLPLQFTAQGGAFGSGIVSSTYYLPPTAANLAHFDLMVPAGFRHRPGTR